MTTVHITYPDGTTSEARYALTMTQVLRLEAHDWLDGPHRVWDTVEDFLDGEWPIDSLHV